MSTAKKRKKKKRKKKKKGALNNTPDTAEHDVIARIHSWVTGWAIPQFPQRGGGLDCVGDHVAPAAGEQWRKKKQR